MSDAKRPSLNVVPLPKRPIANAVSPEAKAVAAAALGARPPLLVEPLEPYKTVARLRDVFANADYGLYDRDGVVRLAPDISSGGKVAQALTPELLIMEVDRACRPYRVKVDKKENHNNVDVNFPKDCATMYLQWCGEWHLPVLRGFASSPLLRDDGTIHAIEGYDAASGLYCEKVPDLTGRIPDHPTRAEAEAALLRLRDAFKTFCFADAPVIPSPTPTVKFVDTSQPPQADESCFLAALLTAIARTSLELAPAVLVRGAEMSGSSTGKGLLVRCICALASGRAPRAGSIRKNDRAELDKFIIAVLRKATPTLFLDNVNSDELQSDLLCSIISERNVAARVMTTSDAVDLTSTAFVAITGNGVSVSEDLIDRFVPINLDAHLENAGDRDFTKWDILADMQTRRAELLAAALTIWRWGRQTSDLKSGRSIRFRQWAAWVRDPLLALGCLDPVEKMGEAKSQDTQRIHIADVFRTMWKRHGDTPIAAHALDAEVTQIIDPKGRGRQFIASQLKKWMGTNLAGFTLTRQPPPMKTRGCLYVLEDHGGGEEAVDWTLMFRYPEYRGLSREAAKDRADMQDARVRSGWFEQLRQLKSGRMTATDTPAPEMTTEAEQPGAGAETAPLVREGGWAARRLRYPYSSAKA